MTLRHRRLPQPLYIAHRGVSNRFPENTLAAFRAAIAAGADMIEFDVTLSRDRQPVVIHDTHIDRTTNGSGRVGSLTLEELGRLDAGSWFDSRFHRETVPSLATVLDTVNGRLLVNIEIKPEAFEPSDPPDSIERRIIDLVAARKMGDAVLISSFCWWSLTRIHRLAPDLALALLSAAPADERLFYWIRRLDAFSWHPDYRLLTAAQVAAVRARGVKVFPYAVNGHIDTGALLAMGVDGLIVDDPQQMLA